MNETTLNIAQIERFLDVYKVEAHSLASQEITHVTDNGDLLYGEADVFGDTANLALVRREDHDTIVDIPVEGMTDLEFIQKMASLYACLGENDDAFIRDVQKMYEHINQI